MSRILFFFFFFMMAKLRRCKPQGCGHLFPQPLGEKLILSHRSQQVQQQLWEIKRILWDFIPDFLNIILFTSYDSIHLLSLLKLVQVRFLFWANRLN